MQKLLYRVIGAIAFASLAAYCHKKMDPSAASTINTSTPAQDNSEDDLTCSNKNVIWRFLRSGAIECKKSLTLNFTDDLTGKPLIGALYRLYLDLYLEVPIKQFFNAQDVPVRTVTLPKHVVFVRLQLADDPENKAPLYAVAKVIPKVTYSLSGLCDVKLKDFSIQVQEVKAPDLGSLIERVGRVSETIVEHYKDQAMAAIQSQLDSVRHNRICWAYRKVFYRGESPSSLDPLAPEGADKAVAEGIVNGTSIPKDAEKSEVDQWTTEKFAAFEKQWSCKWTGRCEGRP